MGLGQNNTFMQWFIRSHVSRQIENQSAQMTLVIIRVDGMYHWQELFHVKEKHFMSTRMLLSQMQCQISWQRSCAAEEALAAHQLQEVWVLPKISKLSVNQFLFQLVLSSTWQVF
jgi:hypothetical protein